MIPYDRIARCTLVLAVALSVLAAEAAQAAERNWSISFHVGLTAAGELFTARSEENEPGWTTPNGTPIPGIQLTTQLDESFGGWVRLRRALSPKVSLALGIGATDMDVTASIKRETNTVDPDIPYDQMFALMTDLVAVYDLLPEGNTFYLLGGLGYNSLSFEARRDGDGLDQGVFALVLGAGYRLHLSPGSQLEFDIRDSISKPDLAAEETRLSPDEFQSNTLHLFQFTLGWAFSF